MRQKNKPIHWIWLQCWPAVWQITILPQVLNTLSAGVLVAEIQRYFLANWQTYGELTLCSIHRRGSVSLSAGVVCEELFCSVLIASVTHSSVFAIIFFFLEWGSVNFPFSPPSFASAAAALEEDPEGAVPLFSGDKALWFSVHHFCFKFISLLCSPVLSYYLTIFSYIVFWD